MEFGIEYRGIATCRTTLLTSCFSALATLAFAQVRLNEIMPANYRSYEAPYREHHDWIELHNASNHPIFLRGYGLSDEREDPYKWTFTSESIDAGGYLVVLAAGEGSDEGFADFRLSSSGETVFLCGPGGESLDSFSYGSIPADYSWGRDPLEKDWRVFVDASAGRVNGKAGRAYLADCPQIDLPSGLFADPFEVPIHLPPSSPVGSSIRYSVDGSEPNLGSPLYTQPLAVTSTTVLRARVFATELHPSEIVTRSYLFEADSDLMTLSLVTDPEHLFEENTGIYVAGPNANPEHPYWGANFHQNWERPVWMELLRTDGTIEFGLDGGLRIHGGISRTVAQKPLRLYARKGYGVKDIEADVFPGQVEDSFRRLVLRNTGADWLRGHLRDGLQHRIAEELDLETSAIRPIRVFLNGEYWGFYNLRERVDQFYLASKGDVDKDDVDLVKNGTAEVGSAADYEELMSYIQSREGAEIDFEYVSGKIDVENFATYYAFRIFHTNRDWPGNNHVHWRTEDRKWRWILHDTEWGMGLGGTPPERETLASLLDPAHPDNRNSKQSTALFRAVMGHSAFRDLFANRAADLLNSILLPERTLPILESMAAEIAGEMPRHMNRWGGQVQHWEFHLDSMEDFLQRRPRHFRSHLRTQLNLGSDKVISVGRQMGEGEFRVSGLSIRQPHWSGIYFADVPVVVEALPAPGYRFDCWHETNGSPGSVEAKIVVEGFEDRSLLASFVRIDEESGTEREEPSIRVSPNPAFGSVHFELEVELLCSSQEDASPLRVAIYSVTGRCVRDWTVRPEEVGVSGLEWDGINLSGHRVPAGVYTVRVTGSEGTARAKLLLLQ